MSVSAVDITASLRRSISEIWDQKLIGRVAEYYSPGVAVHFPGNVTHYGTDAVMTDVTGWLSAFPDSRVYIEGTVVQGDERESRASVCLTFVGHNSGPSVFGPASGRRVVRSRIENSRIQNGRIAEQWLAYDEIGIAEQLGFDVETVLGRLSPASTVDAIGDEIWGGVSGWGGESTTAGRDTLPDGLRGRDLVRAAFEALCNRRLTGAVEQFYLDRYRGRINDRQIFGSVDVQAVIVDMLATLPDLRVFVDDVVCQDEQGAQSTSTRWTVLGTHTGPSRYGDASNRHVRLTGITNHSIVNGRFVTGWTAYNALDFIRQIRIPQEDAPGGMTFE